MSLDVRVLPWSGPALVVTFLALWILVETLRQDEGQQRQVYQDSLGLAANDLVKSVLSISIWFACRWRVQGAHSLSSIPFETLSENEYGQGSSNIQSNYDREPRTRDIVAIIAGSVRPTLLVLLGFVYSIRSYLDLRVREFIDPFTSYLAFPVTVLCTLIVFQIISWRTFPSSFWHAGVLQFAGLYIARNALVGSVLSPYSLLAAFALYNSIWISFVDLVYRLDRLSSVHFINTLIFTQSCLVHFLLFLLHPSHVISDSYHSRFMTALQASPLIETVMGVVTMFVIQRYSAIGLGILTTLASTFLITVDAWKFTETPHSAFVGCLIAFLGSGIFIVYWQHTDEQRHDLSISARRYFTAAIIFLVALGHVIVVVTRDPGTNPSDLSTIWRKILGTSNPSGDRSDCGVPESSTLTHAQTIANYTHFSNILLIVFFSHARYNSNLDFHREVYSDYFPNIVYIGPATREDKGFAHSYDVLVDSFQSEEDLSDPLFYKMSGRMAHHMLYTALREYGCYDGYLWVPFDTLLNIPRLQQFNQSLFWYHSPWGQPVPNPALGDLTEPELNTSRHAPPAMISPDLSINLTETWRGWGPDWWWGDPHVGVSVCMNAFQKVPADMRDHLAQLNNGRTRLIGGSADTLYIPGRHRRAFMDVLALFLETNCFLEIATPTTVHLVVPPGEPIQFVDHWWIYQPPFNTSFVRQKWAEGYEVDTFHTFHWGERREDGVWRGDHRHVADVRHLLRESANRQGLGDTFPVNLTDGDGATQA